jgi:hypothetical protein
MTDIDPKYVNQLERDSHDNSANVTVKRVGLQAWNSSTLQWERVTSTGGVLNTSSAGGGGGAATIADGADVAQGTTTDLSTANTVIGRLKKLVSLLPTTLGQATKANSLPVTIASDQGSIPVDIGSATVTVNASDIQIGAVELKNGTDDTRATITAANALKVDGSAVTQPVSGTFYQATQPVSIASTLTTNATLAAETTKVIGTVNVSAGQSVTANAGTNLNTSALALDATLTGGNQISQMKTVAKGTTAAGQPTSTATDANTQALHTNVTNFPASQAVTGTFYQATQPVSIASTLTTNATLAAETTKVIGTVNVAASQSITATQATGTNLHVVVDTAPTTAVSQSGTWAVGANSATGAAAPANSFYIGVKGSSNNLSGLGSANQLADGVSGGVDGQTSLTALGMLYNGASIDRLRGNWNTTTGDTGTKTASFSGATQTNYNARGAYITIILGTVSGTTPTFTAVIQWSPDAGTTWLALGNALSNLTATSQTGTFVIYPTNTSFGGASPSALTIGSTVNSVINAALPRTWRLNYTIGGTTPSFALTSVQVNYVL